MKAAGKEIELSEQNFDTESQKIWNKPRPEMKTQTNNKGETLELDSTFTGGNQYVAPKKTESKTLIKSEHNSILKSSMKKQEV